jgi:hypothetical protein
LTSADEIRVPPPPANLDVKKIEDLAVVRSVKAVTPRTPKVGRRPVAITSSWEWFSTRGERRFASATVLWLNQWKLRPKTHTGLIIIQLFEKSICL